MGDPRSVPERDALEHLALSEDVRERTDKAAYGLVEPARVPAQEYQSKHAVVQNEPGGGKDADGKEVNGGPGGYHAEDTVWGDHTFTPVVSGIRRGLRGV